MPTYYIRDRYSRNIVDADVGKDDFHVVVCIHPYSAFLLSLKDLDARASFIGDMTGIQELRSEWFEKAMPFTDEPMWQFVERRVREVSKKWNLTFLVD